MRRNNKDQASASDGLYSVDSRRLEPAIKGKRGTTNRAVGFALAERQAERRTRSSTRVLLVDVAGRIRQGPSRCAQSRNSVTRPTRVGPPIVHPSRRGLILLHTPLVRPEPSRRAADSRVSDGHCSVGARVAAGAQPERVSTVQSECARTSSKRLDHLAVNGRQPMIVPQSRHPRRLGVCPLGHVLVKPGSIA